MGFETNDSVIESTAIITRTHTRTAKLSKGGHKKVRDFIAMQAILYNSALEERIDCYRKTGQSISFYDQCKSLTEIRADDAEYGKYSVHVMRSCLNRLDKAFKNYYKRVKEGASKVGFPRFKPRRRMRSFDCPTGSFQLRERKKGWTVNVKGFDPFYVNDIPQGEIKLVRIVVTERRVNVQFVVTTTNEVKPSDASVIGIDMGVNNLVALSTGEIVKGRKRDLKRQKRLQKKLRVEAKKDKGKKTPEHRKGKTRGSKSYLKARTRYAKECQRVRESEHGYIHRETTRIVRLSPNLAIEDLQIQNMTKNPKVARSILEQNWGKFATLLSYKAESAGGKVTRVDPKNTSRMCSGCGKIKTDLSLSERVYSCSNCGIQIDRDVNAAINISRIAKSGGILPGEFGDIVFERPSDPRKRGDRSRAQNRIPVTPNVSISI